MAGLFHNMWALTQINRNCFCGCLFMVGFSKLLWIGIRRDMSRNTIPDGSYSGKYLQGNMRMKALMS